MKPHTHYEDPEGPEEFSPESIFEPMNKIKTLWNKFKTVLQIVGYFFVDCYGFCRSCIVLVFRGAKRPGTFYGYKSFWFATWYSKKRAWLWRSWWDQAGKKQGVLPISDTTLIVCSAMELKMFKKARLVNKNFNPRKAIKKSYYTTEL